MKLLAYHGKQEIKDKYVARMKAHIEADELVRGIGFEGGKGCAVGCTLNNYDHIEYENELGFPMWVAKLEDRLFERMSLEKSKTFPLIFLEAIQPGMILETIKKSFLIYILEQALTTFDNEKFTDVKDSILRVITLYRTNFDTVAEAADAVGWAAWAEESTKAWALGRETAWEVSRAVEAEGAAWAGWPATATAALRAAEAAVWAAAGAMAGAAWAAGTWAADAAEAAAWAEESTGAWARAVSWAGGAAACDKYADKLIELIKQCTIER